MINLSEPPLLPITNTSLRISSYCFGSEHTPFSAICGKPTHLNTTHHRKRTNMKYEVIALPEKHQDYPALWYSDCKFYRIIRCSDNTQYILQRFSRPDWRGFSYHVDWGSIVYRFGDLYTYSSLPVESPEGCSHSGKATLLAVPA